LLCIFGRTCILLCDISCYIQVFQPPVSRNTAPTPNISDASMSLFEIRYDYDTIITKNRDYRYDFRFILKRNNHLIWAIVQQYQPWEQAGEGRRPGGRTGRRWSDAIISVNRSAPVSYAGVVYPGTSLRRRRRTGGSLYQNTAWSQRCADLQILGLLISLSASVGEQHFRGRDHK